MPKQIIFINAKNHIAVKGQQLTFFHGDEKEKTLTLDKNSFCYPVTDSDWIAIVKKSEKVSEQKKMESIFTKPKKPGMISASLGEDEEEGETQLYSSDFQPMVTVPFLLRYPLYKKDLNIIFGISGSSLISYNLKTKEKILIDGVETRSKVISLGTDLFGVTIPGRNIRMYSRQGIKSDFMYSSSTYPEITHLSLINDQSFLAIFMNESPFPDVVIYDKDFKYSTYRTLDKSVYFQDLFVLPDQNTCIYRDGDNYINLMNLKNLEIEKTTYQVQRLGRLASGEIMAIDFNSGKLFNVEKIYSNILKPQKQLLNPATLFSSPITIDRTSDDGSLNLDEPMKKSNTKQGYS